MSRQSKYTILSEILNRWSSRAMSGEELSDEELMPLFEAARFAPSSFNGQPWRFIYAKKDTTDWVPFFDLLLPGNQGWCKDAAVLVVLASHKVFERNGKPSITHSFDCGAAFENLAIEGVSRGLVVHAMQGFDYEKANDVCEIPDEYQVEAMIAIGKKGESEAPEELTERKPLSELVFKGKIG